MTSLLETHERSRALVPGLGLAVGLLAILTLIRLIGLWFSNVDLFFDEAQYWAWSREPAFGYFSKPPLLAWTIALAEHVCGGSEACIRAPAPLFYFGTSLVVYAIARQLYDSRIAFYAALTIALATGTAFSARIISTDVPLLFFWALARHPRRRARPRPPCQVCDDLLPARRGDRDANRPRRADAHSQPVALAGAADCSHHHRAEYSLEHRQWARHLPSHR